MGLIDLFQKTRETSMELKPQEKETTNKVVTCKGCGAELKAYAYGKNLYVCPHCGRYGRLLARTRIRQIADKDTFEELYGDLASADPIHFPGYADKTKELAEKGIRAKGIRLDSGDIAYLSVEARKMLNDAGFSDMQIMASNSLDEYLVRDLIVQGAQIDSFGIGERLITSKSEPVFGGVYKLAAVENEDGEIIPKIKVSENVEKITTPHFKQVYRLFDNKTGKALGDVLTIHDEVIDPALPYVLFHPIHTWKQRVVTDYTVRPLRQQIFKNGECIYQSPSITEIRDYCMREVDTLWDQIKRFENPQTYFVDLSKKLWSCKNELLEACRI